MPTATVADWLILLASLAGMVLFAVAAWWAYFSDRGRSRRRCPKCWFDMKHTSGLRCTECGHAGAAEADLRRTRRRPVIGFLAMLGCAIVGARGIDHLRVEGWGGYMPTSVHVALLDAGGVGFREADAELRRRAADGAIDAGTWMSILEGTTDGSAGAPLGSSGWIGRHGQWALRAWEALVASGDGAMARSARDTVLELATHYPPEIDLEPPPRWPAGREVALGVIVREPWNVPMPMRLVVTPDHGQPVAFARFGPAIQQRSFTIDLPPMPPGRHPVRLDIEMARSLDRGSPWITGRDTTATTVLGIVGDDGTIPVASDAGSGGGPDDGPGDGLGDEPGDDAIESLLGPATEDPNGPTMIAGGDGSAGVRDAGTVQPAPVVPEPVDEPIMTAAISRVFDNGAVQWADGSLPVRITINRRRTHVAALNDVAIGVEVELRRNGRLGRTLELWWMAGNVPSRANEWDVPFVDDSVLLPPTTDEDRWELVVRAREDLALRVPGARYRWDGSFTRPIPVVRRAGMAPSRGWIRVPVPDAAVRSGNPTTPDDRALLARRSGGSPGTTNPPPSLTDREG